MLVEDGFELIKTFIGKEFKTFLSADLLCELYGTDKGRLGKITEILAGLKNTNLPLDFENGELKSYNLKETIFISQISSHIDEMLKNIPFEKTWIFKKIQKVLFILVNKTSSDIGEWSFEKITLLNLEERSDIKDLLTSQWETLCDTLIASIKNSGSIHTANGFSREKRATGKDFIQVRTKDTGSYHPITFEGKIISDKNFAVYFTNGFKNRFL